MRTTMSESNTFLTHTFGRGLEDERYAVERFKSTMDGEIRPAPAGEAKIGRIDIIPVAVDVQVRRATENVGVTDTPGLRLKEAKPVIQTVWRKAVADTRIGGPPGIAGTCAALDPALWFFGKHGCSHCERMGQRVPISRACDHCQFQV